MVNSSENSPSGTSTSPLTRADVSQTLAPSILLNTEQPPSRSPSPSISLPHFSARTAAVVPQSFSQLVLEVADSPISEFDEEDTDDIDLDQEQDLNPVELVAEIAGKHSLSAKKIESRSDPKSDISSLRFSRSDADSIVGGSLVNDLGYKFDGEEEDYSINGISNDSNINIDYSGGENRVVGSSGSGESSALYRGSISTTASSRRLSRLDNNLEEVSITKSGALSNPIMTFVSKYTPSPQQKVFPFSLPFGGLSSITQNFVKHFREPKKDGPQSGQKQVLPAIPRSNSMDTVDEAAFFKDYKYSDDARLRAIRKSLAASVNDMVPLLLKSKPKPWRQSFDELLGNVVLMGGYRGLILRDARSKKRLWIPIKAGFNLRKVDLLLGPNLEDETKSTKRIIPDGILSNVGPLDICKRLIKKITLNPNVNFHNWGYDWRLSGDHLSDQLEAKLQKIYDETGEGSIVLCHSMGGIITQGVVQRRPELFRGIIFIGSPSECLNILGPIRYGDSVGFLDKILTAEANFMMRLSFLLLPLSGQVFVDKDTKERYDLDLFDPDTWVEYNLNPLVAHTRIEEQHSKQSSILSNVHKSDSTFSLTDLILNSISSRIKNFRKRTESFGNKEKTSNDDQDKDFDSDKEVDEYHFTFEQCYEYLARELKRTKEFLLNLQYDPKLDRKYPPMAMVYGNTTPLVRGSYVPGIQGIKDGDYYNFFFGHGDGVVHQRWLLPQARGFDFYDPKTDTGHIVGKFPSSCGHVSLMTDLEAIGNAISLITEAEQIWANRK